MIHGVDDEPSSSASSDRVRAVGRDDAAHRLGRDRIAGGGLRVRRFGRDGLGHPGSVTSGAESGTESVGATVVGADGLSTSMMATS